MSRGIWSAVGAQVAWGLFPVYWKALIAVPGLELVAHRFVWSFVLLAALLVLQDRGAPARLLASPRLRLVLPAAGLLIGVNWFTFLWAVDAGLVVEASLGYFITPLVNVGFGVLVLGERLRRGQWLAIALATAGMLYLTFVYGAFPRIALVLASSFGLYGLIKKTARVEPVAGLAAETGALAIPSGVYLLLLGRAGSGVWGQTDGVTQGLLLTTGLVTIAPLLLFASAVRRIPLSLMGVLQYIAPTLQFLVGVLVFREPFSSDQLVGFALVWLALVIFTADGARRRTPVTERPTG